MSTLLGNDINKQNLIEKIKFMISTSPEELRLVLSDAINVYFNSYVAFGTDNHITLEAKRVIKDIFKIMKLEKSLLKHVLKNLDCYDLDAAENCVCVIDDLNDKTYNAYEGILDNINNAVKSRDDKADVVPHGGIDSLISNRYYIHMVMGLGETDQDVRNYLGYDKSFWEFISSHLKKVPGIGEYGIVPIIDNDDKLVNMYVVVPEVVDFDTAIQAISIYRKAYFYFMNIGKKLSDIVYKVEFGPEESYSLSLKKKKKNKRIDY